MVAKAHLRLASDADEPDRLSFDEAYRRYASYVGTIALRIVGRRSEVDDIVQDVFLRAFPRWETVERPGAARSYLATIAVRVCSDRLRTRKWLHALRYEPIDDLVDLAVGGASPEERVILRRVYRALDRLDPALRVAWVLRRLQGERLDEVARLVDCSLATVKRRVTAADEAVRKAVADD